MIARNEVDVFIDMSGSEPVRAGVLRASFSGGRNLASASFTYDEAFLARSDAYAISPDLPLTTGRTYTGHNQNLFGAFSDASPDLWGQKIVEANHAIRFKADPTLPRTVGDFDFLTGVSNFSRMGALRLRGSADSGWLSSDAEAANIHDLDRVLAAARRYEAHEATDADVAYLSDIATSPGGARPKANVITGSGRLALAKLPHSKDDDTDVEAWESVALTLARNIGALTPQFTEHRASADKTVLVVDRFDRTETGGRLHYISAASALGIGKYDDGRVTYEQFADTITELSSDPASDLREMFGRVALTVLINNVDDHWKNHGFLRGPTGWRLSPIFDVNPNPKQGVISSRAISADDDPRHRDIRNLIRSADAYRLTEDQASSIVRSVATEVERWPALASKLGIPAEQQDAMAAAFDETQLAAAHALTPKLRTTTILAPSVPRRGGEVWVKPHIRMGSSVEGHWRKSRRQ